MSDTLERLKNLLIERLKITIGSDAIQEETELFSADGLDLDSIDVLELIVGIKKEFGVEIVDREIAEKVFISVGSIVRYIEENR